MKRLGAWAFTVIALALLAGTLACGRRQTEIVPVEIALSAPAATATPVAVPLPTPVPTPTPAPTPTPTADPFAGLTRASLPEDARFFYVPLPEQIRTRIIGTSYPENAKNAPVSLDDLRYVHICYVDFDGEEQEGELIVHRLVADDILTVFYTLYTAKYPLESVHLVDDYGEAFDDNLSMAANNTSAYCCRRVTGSRKFSLHAYGLAVDINPVMNPYVNGKAVSPEAGAEYVDRSLALPGMIDHDDLCYRSFTACGWTWGGDFTGDPDYQHFSKDLRDGL